MENEYTKHIIYGNFLSMQGQDFPMDCETLAALQNNTKKLAVIASVAGCDRLVLTGCEESGNHITEGYVFIRSTENPLTGEILYHPEQVKSDYCRIAETDMDVTANTIDYPGAYTQRYLESRNGSGAMHWTSFKRLDALSLTALLDAIQSEADERAAAIRQLAANPSVKFVRGMILMWSGYVSEIPEGWALCDGNNGTPPLSGRFVVCVKAMGGDPSGHPIYNERAKDGAESQTITLTAENMPTHSHRASMSTAGAHTHSFEDNFYPENLGKFDGTYNSHATEQNRMGSGDTDYDNNRIAYLQSTTGSAGAHSHTVTIQNAGEGRPFTVNTMPPYYALAYIMKL